jgi:small-conductance mechanosensitive channel
MFSGARPDITPAQLSALVGWIVAQAVAFGWVDSDQAQILISGGATIVAAAWKIADSLLRGKRALAQGPQV